MSEKFVCLRLNKIHKEMYNAILFTLTATLEIRGYTVITLQTFNSMYQCVTQYFEYMQECLIN